MYPEEQVLDHIEYLKGISDVRFLSTELAKSEFRHGKATGEIGTLTERATALEERAKDKAYWRERAQRLEEEYETLDKSYQRLLKKSKKGKK